jgi:diguanylate cyclase (GGDEF)-like protein
MKSSLRHRSARVLGRLERLPSPFVVAGAALLVVTIAVLDWLTPLELSLAVFHVIPVFLAAWLVGRRSGLAFALAAALSWYLADALHPDAPPMLRLLSWSIVTKVLFFVVISELITALRIAMDRLHVESRTDPLTGLLNRRAFYERAEQEVGRASRTGTPLVLGYIDVDDFKGVNDGFGHEVGDRVLVSLARALARSVRGEDVVARLGGDEFAVLFLDADTEAAGAIAVQLETAVAQELGMLEIEVSFSIGLVSWTDSLRGMDDLLRAADKGMYRVKARRKGKAETSQPGVRGSAPRERRAPPP